MNLKSYFKKWIALKKWFNKNKVLSLFICFIIFLFLLYHLFAKSCYEGYNLNKGTMKLSDGTIEIKTWYFNKSSSWYKLKQGVDIIPFKDTGFSTNSPEISITFSYNNLKGQPYWRNIFHFTNNNDNWGDIGDRVPAMWVMPDNTNNFHIVTSTDNNPNYWHNTTDNQPFGVPVFIAIVVESQQIKYYKNNNLIETITCDGNISTRNNNTTLQIGDAWHGQDGSILIKDFTLYDTALTSQQINQMYDLNTFVNPIFQDDGNNNGLKYTIYDGTFTKYDATTNDYKDDLSFFNTASTLYSGSATNFKNVQTATEEFMHVDKDQLYSIVWEGYFLPDVSGKWTFGMNSDDASYMWIGENVNNHSTSNANIKNSLLHGMRLVKCEVELEQGKYYPIRIVFSQNHGGADFQFFYSTNSTNSPQIYDFNGKFFKTAVSSPTSAPTSAKNSEVIVNSS